MAIGTINGAVLDEQPKGELTYCGYRNEGIAGLGTDYCFFEVDSSGVAKICVVLNEDNRFGDPVIERTYSVDRSIVDSLGLELYREEILNLDGYNVDEAMCGGRAYSFGIRYSSGERVRAYWYGHEIKTEALKAYGTIERFFDPWRERARKDAELVGRVARITEMEAIYKRVARAVKKKKPYPGLREDVDTLMDYLDSKKWREDFEADERGELPEGLKRGVLSEDGLYNLLESDGLFNLMTL